MDADQIEPWVIRNKAIERAARRRERQVKTLRKAINAREEKIEKEYRSALHAASLACIEAINARAKASKAGAVVEDDAKEGTTERPRPGFNTVAIVIRDAIDRQSGDDNPSRVARNVVHALREAGFDIVWAEVINDAAGQDDE